MEEMITHIIRKGMYEVAEYFRDLIEGERIKSRVPVLIQERPLETILFVEADLKGIPKRMIYEFLTFNMPVKMWEVGADLSTVPDMAVRKKTIRIERPIMHQTIAWGNPYGDVYYFLWEGRLEEDKELALEDLDVKYLQQLSQEAIKKREPVILDEVSKNKLFPMSQNGGKAA